MIVHLYNNQISVLCGVVSMAKISTSKRKLSDYVLDEIKRMLISGELKEGDKLPNQNEFAMQLGVSRLPLREAMQKLSQLGVIEEKPGVGTRIISGDPSTWAVKLEAPFLSDSQAALELLEARRILETAIILASVKRLDDDDINALHNDIIRMESALKKKDTRAYLKSDLDFHFHIASGTHNRFLMNMLQTIHKLLEQFMMEIFNEIPNLIPDSMEYHTRIFDHVRNHELKAAAASMKGHLGSIEHLLKEYYKERKIVVPAEAQAIDQLDSE
jgi:GntR family transcriptional regulator, transcriptional repressor for pyruvate dehydrogenase complex